MNTMTFSLSTNQFNWNNNNYLIKDVIYHKDNPNKITINLIKDEQNKFSSKESYFLDSGIDSFG